MTDLDFDELDKAVNNLMSTVDTTKRNPGLDDPEDTVVSITPSTSPAPTPVVSASQAPSVQTAEPDDTTPPVDMIDTPETPTTSSESVTPLAVKRRGQFMDIMGPGRTAPAPVSRQGVSIQPSSDSVVSETPAEPVAAQAEESAIVMPDLDLESTGSAQPGAVVMPDPIDMATPSVEEDSEHSEEATTDTPIEPDAETVTALNESEQTAPEKSSDDLPSEVVDEIAGNSQASEEEPLSSPFLPDAKVDKRPLGSPVAMPDPIEVSTDEVPAADSLDEEKADPEPIVATESLAVETEPVATAEVTTPAEGEEKAAEDSVAEVEEEPSLDKTVDTHKPAEEPTQPPAGGSIAQQYAEKPSTGDQTSGAIFDTATYHKTVEEPVKKKSSKVVTIILWVLVLIAVGAAAGAGYFYWSTR